MQHVTARNVRGSYLSVQLYGGIVLSTVAPLLRSVKFNVQFSTCHQVCGIN